MYRNRWDGWCRHWRQRLIHGLKARDDVIKFVEGEPELEDSVSNLGLMNDGGVVGPQAVLLAGKAWEIGATVLETLPINMSTGI